MGKGPRELADGLYYIASVGYKDAAQSVDVLNVAASDLNDTTALLVQGSKASSVGMGELGDITKIMVAISRQFADENLDIVTIYDKLFVAIRAAGGETDEFASTLGRALLPVSCSAQLWTTSWLSSLYSPALVSRHP